MSSRVKALGIVVLAFSMVSTGVWWYGTLDIYDLSETSLFIQRKIDITGTVGFVETIVEYPYAETRNQTNLPESNIRVIYNRIPKCGSMTVLTMLKELARRNRFTFLSSTEYNRVSIPRWVEKTLVKGLQRKQTPWLYNRHVRMLNFTKYGYQMPEYINIMREPIDRARSHFYYSNGMRKKMTFDECVRKDVSRCVWPTLIVRYFGEGEKKQLLQVAKRNIERHYSIVGLTEDLESTFQLLEIRYPELFAGVLDVYRSTTSMNVDTKGNLHKVLPSTKKKLEQIMATDIELYEFVKQRFYKAKEEAGLL